LAGIKLSDSVQDLTVSAECLALLGVLFRDTNVVYSEKMFTTCLRFAEKARCLSIKVFALEQLGSDKSNAENEYVQGQLGCKNLNENMLM
jgi:hypothetical protein